MATNVEHQTINKPKTTDNDNDCEWNDRSIESQTQQLEVASVVNDKKTHT